MSRRLVFEIVGDDASALRSFRRTSAAANTFERDINKATRGALAGSGIFRSMGRSLAFASGGFLAFATAGQFLRSSVDAAREAEVAQAQLAQQLRNSGKNFADYRDQIAQTNLRLGALAGFTDSELNASLTTILRTVPNVSRALKDNALAADLARAKHISLAQAALVIAKTEAGNTTLLRRQGFQIAKNATVEQALAAVRARVAGQARAGTTEAERFGAVLHDTEEIIGAGLLPTLNKYLIAGTRWLQQMDESGRLQHDVSKAAGDVEKAVSLGAHAFRDIRSAIELADKFTGSFENTLKDLAAVMLVLKARTALVGIGFLNIGSRAAIAKGEAVGLKTELSGLASLGPIAIPITLAITTEIQKGLDKAKHRSLGVKDLSVAAQLSSFIGKAFPGSDVVAKAIRAAINGTAPPKAAPGANVGLTGPTDFLGGAGGTVDTFQPGAKPPRPAAQAPTRKPLSLQGQFNLLELRKANAEAANQTKLVRSILVSEAGIVHEQEASATKLKDRTAFAQQLAGIMSEIRSIDSQDAQTQKDTARHAKEAAAAAKKRREEEKKRIEQAITARQFRALGLDATGQPLTPSTAALKRELGSVSTLLEGTFLDTKSEQSVLSRIRKVLSGGLGAVRKDVRDQIKGMLDDIKQQLNQSSDLHTPFVKANFDPLLKSLTDLSRSDRLRLRAALSQVGPGGTIPRHGVGAFGAVVPADRGGDVVIHNVTKLNDRVLEQSVTRVQQKRKLRSSSQVRGPHAGGGL